MKNIRYESFVILKCMLNKWLMSYQAYIIWFYKIVMSNTKTCENQS